MRHIFEEAHIGRMKLKNRLVRSAMWENLATDKGHMSEELFTLYEDLSKGGVGLIITGYAFVTPNEQPSPGMMGICDDTFIDEYKKLTDMVHLNDSKIVMQIAYGGSQTGLSPEGRTIWGPSNIPDLAFGVIPTPMTREDIRTLVKAFGAAAKRTKEAGFDGVQIHGAHGYLLSQFLTPHYNRRTDEYGGTIQNRARIIEEIYHEIRQEVGNDYPVLLKFNAADFFENGLTFEESRYVAQRFDTLGIDALEISGGTFASGEQNPCRTKINTAEREAYHAEFAARVANEVTTPVLVVGGLRSPEVIEELLETTKIGFFSLARPLLTEPDLPQQWQNGNRSRAKCVSCNVCLQGRRCVLTNPD